MVGGVAGLFDTDEACAARMLFYYLAGETSSADLANAWRRLDVGIDEEELAAGLTPEQRRNAQSIPMLEELFRSLPPEMHERIARRRAERGLPPLIGGRE